MELQEENQLTYNLPQNVPNLAFSGTSITGTGELFPGPDDYDYLALL